MGGALGGPAARFWNTFGPICHPGYTFCELFRQLLAKLKQISENFRFYWVGTAALAASGAFTQPMLSQEIASMSQR